jgi:hypothetical protein
LLCFALLCFALLCFALLFFKLEGENTVDLDARTAQALKYDETDLRCAFLLLLLLFLLGLFFFGTFRFSNDTILSMYFLFI